jgi:hypothetical protein
LGDIALRARLRACMQVRVDQQRRDQINEPPIVAGQLGPSLLDAHFITAERNPLRLIAPCSPAMASGGPCESRERASRGGELGR